jgi:hypothetical protein
MTVINMMTIDDEVVGLELLILLERSDVNLILRVYMWLLGPRLDPRGWPIREVLSAV